MSKQQINELLTPHKCNDVNETDKNPLYVYQTTWRLGPPPGGNLETKVDKVDSNHWKINHNWSFEIPDPGPTETILDINWCFARILLNIDRSNSGTDGSTFSKY